MGYVTGQRVMSLPLGDVGNSQALGPASTARAVELPIRICHGRLGRDETYTRCSGLEDISYYRRRFW